MNEIKKEYFNWLSDLAVNDKMRRNLSYEKLLNFLFNKEFKYVIPMDKNRYVDGVDLRYRFGFEKGYSNQEIGMSLDDMPCSILEMMIALSLRIEEQIMYSEDIGDRTWKWFWEMVINMGLGQMTDEHFNKRKAEFICDRLINRGYEPNGKGGLFTIYHRTNDMRNVEIWYQAMWYLTELDDVM